MLTQFAYVLSVPVPKAQNLSNSTPIYHSLKCITEIPNNESIQEKIEKFWEIVSFEAITTNFIVYDNFCNNIRFYEVEYRYHVRLPFKVGHDLPITIAKPN